MSKDLETVRFGITIEIVQDGLRYSLNPGIGTLEEIPAFELIGALEYVKQMIVVKNNTKNMKQWIEDNEKFKELKDDTEMKPETKKKTV